MGIKEESLVSLAANGGYHGWLTSASALECPPLVGSNSVPLGALIHFAHQAFCYEQYEVLDILGGAVVKAAVGGQEAGAALKAGTI